MAPRTSSFFALRPHPFLGGGLVLAVLIAVSALGIREFLRDDTLHSLRDLHTFIALIVVLCLAIIAFVADYLAKHSLLAESRIMQERLQASLASGRSVSWDLDVPSGVNRWVGDLQTMFGISSDTFSIQVGEFYQFVHPDDRQRVSEAVADARDNRRQYAAEFRILRKDGAIRWVNATGEFLYKKDGKPERMLGVAVDVTDRKLAEEARIKSEEKFSKAFRQSPMVLTLTNAKDYRYLDVNETFEQITGWTRDEVLGRTPFDISLWVEPEERHRIVEQIVATGSARNYDVHFRCKDGRLGVGLGSAELMDLDGEKVILAAIADITDRKQAEAALHQSEEQLRAALLAKEDQLRFEQLFSAISSRFVNLTANQVDGAIGASLCLVAEFLGIDECTIFLQEPEDANSYVLSYVHRDSNLSPPPTTKFTTQDNFPWSQQQLIRNQTVCVPDTEAAPSEAAIDKANWKKYGVYSTLSIPLSTGGKLPLGIWGIDSTSQKREWPEPLQKRLKLIAEVFANALERKRAEEKLQENEARLSLAADSARAGFWTLNIDTGEIWATDTTRELFGVGATETLDYNRYLSLIHAEDREKVRTVISAMRSEGKEASSEYRVVWPDGSLHWMMSRATIYASGSSGRNILTGITIDITDRKLGEEALRKKQKELSEAQQLAEMGSWEMEIPTMRLTWSDELYRLHGLDLKLPPPTLEELEHLFTPESWQKFCEAKAVAMRDGACAMDLEVVWPDGTHRWLATRGEILRNAQGVITTLRGTAQDITERKLVEARLREYEKAIEGTQEMIAVVDRDYRYVIVNAAFLDVHGMSREEVIGRKAPDVVGEEPFEQIMKAKLDDAFRGNVVQFEMDYTYPRRGKRTLFKSYFPVQGHAGIEQVVCVLEDVTERRKAEKALHESERRLHVAFEAGRMFAFEWDPQTDVLVRSPEYVQVLGNEHPAEITLDRLIAQIHADDREHFEQSFKGVTPENPTSQTAFRLIGPEGKELWLERTLRGQFDDDGNLTRAIGVVADITTRKLAELDRRETEEKFRRVVEHIGDAVIADDADGKVIFANDRFLQLFGLKREDIGRVAMEHYIAPEYRALLIDRHNRRLRGEAVPSHFEYQGLKIDGTRMWLEVDVVPIRDSRGKITGTQSAIRDITDRRRAEESLRHSEEFSRQVLLGSPVAMIVTSGDHQKIERANHRFLELFGYTLEEIPDAEHWWPLAYPDEAYRKVVKEEWTRRTEQALQETARIQPMEAMVHCKDHSTRYIEFHFASLGDTGLVSFVDLTERKRAELELRESEERFRLVANSAPVMIWMSDTDKLCTYFNKQWLDFTGRSIEKELGNGWLEGIHPDDVEHCFTTYTQSFDSERPFELQYRLRRFDGEFRWILDTGVPRFNPDGSLSGYIGSCIDITDRKAAEQALASVGRRLIEAHEEERTWIGRELHDDINQRLALVAVELDRALKGSVAEQTDKAIRHAQERILEVSKDVQGLSHRLHSSKLEYLGLASAAKGFCRELSEQGNVDISFTHSGIPRYLPKEISLCLFRVLQEALQNSVKHSGARQFTVELCGDKGRIELCVVDKGAGFSENDALTTKGIGLISMRERLQMVGGQFSMTSKPGSGTVIRATVRIPAEEADAVAS